MKLQNIIFSKDNVSLSLCDPRAMAMASAPKQPQQHPSTSKPPRHPSSAAAGESQILNPNPNPSTSLLPPMANSPITMAREDQILARSTHLTRTELLRRRSHHLKQLSKVYRDHYWALMEDLKAQYREYYWRFGVSPFKDEQNQPNKRPRLGPEGETGDGDPVEGCGENGNNNGGSNGVTSDPHTKSCSRCSYGGCKFKAMALTNFCHLHIVNDKKQKLYKACEYVIKRAQSGPITCSRPTLASTVPSLCNMHFLKAQKHVARALKDAGLNVSSSSKVPPKFHVIIAAFVHHIQGKRKASVKEDKLKSVVKEEHTS
ncbi:PREDICTED: INO80 complex subunit D-like [Tarenaya hassleriana]|uniref:INO80 complex subunit D-like n=1 Tax=Tarenaya hassleriana TaxID=28532 RepID=UPI00053C5CB4|nr:PREDICTED: INO80 complex subunit D-like [Tarenaya hassleriana]XP_010542756.1 PREDICTED: INO80 complex subunit D-like [Tarenaya hassleriana]